MEAGLQRVVTGHCVMFARFFVEVDTDVAPLRMKMLSTLKHATT